MVRRSGFKLTTSRKSGLWLSALVLSIVGSISLGAKPTKWDAQRIDRIIFVTIDTLRADHLGCYGYPRDTSPFLDELAEGGILFRNAVAHMSTTVPSHASMFTSLYPLQHNVLRNRTKLDDSLPTMAEALGTQGYRTAAFVSFWSFGPSASNLSQGFETFDDDETTKSESKTQRYRTADRTIDAAIEWVDQRRPPDRFFLWVHLFDPHTPYLRRGAVLRKLKDRGETDSLAEFLVGDHHVDLGIYGGDRKRMLETMDLYDSEILFADTQLRRLYERLHEKELDSHTLWIVTADHGEGLGNHRWRGHGKHIYNEQIRIPLLFNFSSGARARSSVEETVEHVDLVPTVLELLGGEAFRDGEGVSLVPLLSGARNTHHITKYAFTQRRPFDADQRPARIVPQATQYEDGEKYSLQTDEYKYIYRTKGSDEFYDLKKDPYEVNNLIGSNTKAERTLRAEILARLRRLQQASGEVIEFVDEKALEQLRSLGYIE